MKTVQNKPHLCWLEPEITTARVCDGIPAKQGGSHSVWSYSSLQHLGQRAEVWRIYPTKLFSEFSMPIPVQARAYPLVFTQCCTIIMICSRIPSYEPQESLSALQFAQREMGRY